MSARRVDTVALCLLGRRVSHLTPRYLIDRSKLLLFERQHPDAPWLTADAISILSTALRKADTGLEWGSGRSTCWLAKRTRSLVSIESSEVWYGRVRSMLEENNISNVEYRHIPATKLSSGQEHSYVTDALTGIEPNSIDYILIDGDHRDECAVKAVELLKCSGLLIVDNAERYIPYPTRSPERLKDAPTSRWREFMQRVAGWRLIWTTNGITDTAIWMKAP